MNKRVLEVDEILHAIKKRKLMIFLIIFVFLVLSGVYGFVLKKENHTATVKIFSGKTQAAESYTINELENNSTLMDTYIELIKTDNFMKGVIAKSGVNITTDELKNTVGFIKNGSTPILTITYTAQNKEIAKKVVGVIATEFEKEVKETILNINTKVIEDVKVVTNYPAKEKYLILGFIAAIIVSLGLVFILDYLDNSIKDKEQLERLLLIPVLGELPLEKLLIKDK